MKALPILATVEQQLVAACVPLFAQYPDLDRRKIQEVLHYALMRHLRPELDELLAQLADLNRRLGVVEGALNASHPAALGTVWPGLANLREQFSELRDTLQRRGLAFAPRRPLSTSPDRQRAE